MIDLSAVHDSIITNNRVGAVSDNCSSNAGAIGSSGFNFSDTPDADCDLFHLGDQTNSDPLQLALADNGGPTFTHLPDERRPAVEPWRDAEPGPAGREQFRGQAHPVPRWGRSEA